MDTIVTLTITLDGVEPKVWRRLEVPAAYHLGELHAALNIAMGWVDYHLHAFDVGGRTYGVPDLDFFPDDDKTLPEENTVLGDLMRAGVKNLAYRYDFGDSWRCTVALESTGPADDGAVYPRCTDGRRAAPPEDCGGLPGFADFTEAMADPSHPEHGELKDWFGGEFDPEEFDVERVNKVLRLAATGELPQEWGAEGDR